MVHRSVCWSYWWGLSGFPRRKNPHWLSSPMAEATVLGTVQSGFESLGSFLAPVGDASKHYGDTVADATKREALRTLVVAATPYAAEFGY